MSRRAATLRRLRPLPWLLASALGLSGCFAMQRDQKRLEHEVIALRTEVRSLKSFRADFYEQRVALLEAIDKAKSEIAKMEGTLARVEKFTSSQFADNFQQLERAVADQAQLRGRIDETRYSLEQLRERLDALDSTVQGLSIETAGTTAASGGEQPAPTPSATPAPGQADTGKGPLPEEPKPFYELAFSTLRAGQPDEARKLFATFIARWPEHGLCDNARYWMGETYYVKGRYQNAITEFAQVLDRYPKGDKVPDALLKLGMSFSALGLCEDARVFYEQLTAEHRSSPVAKKAKERVRDLEKTCKTPEAQP